MAVTTIALPNGQAINVSIDSTLIPSDQLGQDTIDQIREACEIAALNKAVDLWGPTQALTVRDLNGTDMSYTANVMTDTSNATGNQWNAMGTGPFTVPTATVIGIYGVMILVDHNATIDYIPITGIRIDVGGARVAQWHTQCIDHFTAAASTGTLNGYAGITRSPIVAAEDIAVTISEYTQNTLAGNAYDPVWLGVAVEKEGRTLKP